MISFEYYGLAKLALAEKNASLDHQYQLFEIAADSKDADSEDNATTYNISLSMDNFNHKKLNETSNFDFFLQSKNHVLFTKDDSYLDIIEDFNIDPSNNSKTDVENQLQNLNNSDQNIDKYSDKYHKTISYYFRGQQKKSPSLIKNPLGNYGIVISVNGLFYNPKNIGYRLRIGYNDELYKKSFATQIDVGSFAIYYGIYGIFAKTETRNKTSQTHASLGIDAEVMLLYQTPLNLSIGPVIGLELTACNYNVSWRFCFAPVLGVDMIFAKYFFINYTFKLPLTIDKGLLKHSFAATHSLGLGIKIIL